MRSPLGVLAQALTPTNKAPVSYAARSGLNLATPARSDAAQQMAAMGSVGTLFAIVSRLANATSQAKWRLYRTTTDMRRNTGPAEMRRTEVVRHAALDLLNKPNPFATRQEFMEGTQQHVDLTGEGWWVVSTDPDFPAAGPLEMWSVRPDRISPVPSPTEFISGYVYTGPNGEKVPLRRDEVIQLRMPNPLDPYRGMGPVQSILTDLDSTRYSAEWNRNFFRNSAEPGGIIEIDKRLSDEEFDEMTVRWREQHQGVARAHRVAILEQGKWVDRSMSQKDMQFVELREVSREVIREAFGFPKPLLGSVDDVNRANAEAGEVVFARWLIVPRLERIKQALNNDLLPLFGPTTDGLEFDYDNPVPEDEAARSAELTSRANAAAALVQAGYYAPDVLRVVGLPEVGYGSPTDDPERALLIDLVKSAPTLAPLILPLLGIQLPTQGGTDVPA